MLCYDPVLTRSKSGLDFSRQVSREAAHYGKTAYIKQIEEGNYVSEFRVSETGRSVSFTKMLGRNSESTEMTGALDYRDFLPNSCKKLIKIL